MLNPLNPLVLSNGVLRIVLSGDLGSTNGAASTKGVLDISIVGERGSDGTGSSLVASGIWMAAISGLFGEGDLDGDREAGRTGLDEEEAVEF